MMICVLFTTQAKAVSAEDILSLSQMTEEECLDFIKENGVILHDVRENESDWGPFVKKIIILAESDPDVSFGISYTVAAELAEDIRDVVIMHYGCDQQDQSFSRLNNVSINAKGRLSDSEVYSEWDDDFLTYNCYMYAVDLQYRLNFAVNPGYYAYLYGYTDEYNFLDDFYYGLTVQGIADYVTCDLLALGHTRIRQSLSSMDISNLCTNEKIICLRRGVEDYHFMKYTSAGWLHKPSNTRILRYKYTPTDDLQWSNERMGEHDAVTENLWYYDSEIIFMSYDGHDWQYSKNNNGTHTLTCSICGDTGTTETCNLTYTCINKISHRGVCADCGYTTSASECEYTYEGNGNRTHTATCTVCGGSIQSGCTLKYTKYSNSKHRVTCTVCGTSSLANCTIRYTHRNDATLGHVHTQGCNVCGNIIETENTPCTFEYMFAGTVNGSNTHHNACTACGYKKNEYALCLYKNSNKCTFCGISKDVSMTTATDEMNPAE